MNRLVASSVALAMWAAAPAYAQQTIDLDLGGPATVTLPAPSAPVRLRIINRIPNKDYTVSVMTHVTPIDGLAPVTGGATLAGPSSCSQLLTEAEDLDGATAPKSEKEVKGAVESIRLRLASGGCSDSQSVQAIQLALARTMIEIPGVQTVGEGSELVLTVIRVEGTTTLTWRLTLQGGSRGKWLTTFGMAFAPNRDTQYFTRGIGATGGAPFVITKEEDMGGLKPIPSVFFSWMPRSRQDRDWAVGPGAGFGLEGGNRPAVFAGLSATYNWNIGVIAGLAMVPEKRLNGRYSDTTPPQSVSADIDAAALHVTTVSARAFFALTFRFGSNPFTAPTAQK